MGRTAQGYRESAWRNAIQDVKMKALTRTRILLVALFLFPLLVMIFFWLFGKSPENPAATLPLLPSH